MACFLPRALAAEVNYRLPEEFFRTLLKPCRKDTQKSWL